MKKIKFKKVKFPKCPGIYACKHKTHGWQIQTLVKNEAGDFGWTRVKDQNEVIFLSADRLKTLILQWYLIKGA